MAARRKAPGAFKLDPYIFGALRRIWGWYPPRRQAYAAAKISGQDRYRCSNCSVVVAKKLVHCDHILPAVPVSGFVDWNTHIERLFCDVSNLAILCKPCHKVKTSGEAALRKKYRDKK